MIKDSKSLENILHFDIYKPKIVFIGVGGLLTTSSALSLLLALCFGVIPESSKGHLKCQRWKQC